MSSRFTPRTYRWRQVRAVVLASSSVCHLCGRPGATEVDHVEPVSRRPDLAYDFTNLRPAHRSCNARKGDRPANVALGASRRW